MNNKEIINLTRKKIKIGRKIFDFMDIVELLEKRIPYEEEKLKQDDDISKLSKEEKHELRMQEREKFRQKQQVLQNNNKKKKKKN